MYVCRYAIVSDAPCEHKHQKQGVLCINVAQYVCILSRMARVMGYLHKAVSPQCRHGLACICIAERAHLYVSIVASQCLGTVDDPSEYIDHVHKTAGSCSCFVATFTF